MANIIEQITLRAAGKVQPQNWYKTQVRELGGASPNKLLQSGKFAARIIPGNMYLFKYDPKDKDFNLNERIDLNNLLYKFFNNNEGMFGPAIDIVRLATDMSDEEINNYSNDEIFAIAISISNFVNKKKVKSVNS